MKSHIVPVLAMITAIFALIVSIKNTSKEDIDTIRMNGIRSGRRYSVTIDNQSKRPVFLYVEADLPERQWLIGQNSKTVIDNIPLFSRVRLYRCSENDKPAPGALQHEETIKDPTVITVLD